MNSLKFFFILTIVANTDPFFFFFNLTTFIKLVTQHFWPVVNNPAEFGDWNHF